MTSNEEMAQRWHDAVRGRKHRALEVAGCRVWSRGDRIYSYGTHFEMARPLRNRRGEVEAYLLNGDRASVSTDRHQGIVRSVLRNERTVIIPHEALGAAGIDLDSIKVLDVQEDRWETLEHSSPNWDDVPIDSRTRLRADAPVWGYGSERYEALPREADGLYHWTTQRHWLGGSLIRAKVEWFERETCQHCKGQPMEGPQLQNRFGALYEVRCHECHSAGTVTVRKHRWATFLSSFDEQETRPSYFFCELPHNSGAKTIAEAYESLKPDAVLLAEQMGREVSRQGDIFAIPAPSMTKAQLRKQGARIERMGNLLGTNHAATEVAYLPGLTLARGIMHHVPEGRRPDHARRPMGDRRAWHIIQKNRVPVAA